ncbi:hypothetical protein ACFQXB_05350 [Plastorhodobacter daqingensis]|uniref:DUF7210 domain-containing protein n=1 Tax=Plastorhodobacter daqingensis TaxID=1387281 RepID=A0ABW2UHG7_9RHOB
MQDETAAAPQGTPSAAPLDDRLPPEITAYRDGVLERFAGLAPGEAARAIATLLKAETNEGHRTALLLARIAVLRRRITAIATDSFDPAAELAEPDPAPAPAQASAPEPAARAEPAFRPVDSEEPDVRANWKRVRLTRAGEVNGVRFPEGAVIEVQAESAEWLIGAGAAVLVEDAPPEAPPPAEPPAKTPKPRAKRAPKLKA